jgi:hypothetical protein
MVLATVPIVGYNRPKKSPTNPFPIFRTPRRLLASSPDNSGISLVLLCNEMVVFVVLFAGASTAQRYSCCAFDGCDNWIN